MAQPPSQADRLSRLIDGLLALEERLRLGHPSHRAVEDNDETGRALAAELNAIFAGRQPRPVNPPLWISQDGRSAWW